MYIRKTRYVERDKCPAVESDHAEGGSRLEHEGSRGQAIVELAFLLPVLLLMVLAAVDFGRVFLGWVVLNNAARVGANYAASNPMAWGTPGDANEQAEYLALVNAERVDAYDSLSNCQAVPNPVFPNGKDLGDLAVVQLDCQFEPLTPLIGQIFEASGNQFTVSARSVFPIRSAISAVTAPTVDPICATPLFNWSFPDPEDWHIVQFTDFSENAPEAWSWDFGDGSPGTIEQSPEHVFADDGTFAVTLTVDPGTGCEQSLRLDVLVEEGAEPPLDPGLCLVPNFVGTNKDDASTMWTSRPLHRDADRDNPAWQQL